ncbi:hypothetical protein JYT36_00130 [Bacteroidales bacterium AH-315-N07]|nr:hypothetical protein [Bacteroidales bacterium AH-315-N07]
MSEALSLNETSNEQIEFFEELKFWKNHQSDILLLGMIPQNIPDISSIRELIEQLKINRDYFAIVKRIKVLEKWLWGSPVLRIVEK